MNSIQFPATKKAIRNHGLAAIDALSELQIYQDQPQQMKAGAKGKVGILELTFEKKNDKSVLSHLYRVAPLLVQQGLYIDESWPSLPMVPIISVGGGTLQGDRYAIDIEVKDNAEAWITTQSATRIQEMNTNYATQFQSIRVGKNAYLEYTPDTTILYKNSRYACENKIIVDETGVLIFGETIMLGRKHYKNERYQFELFSTKVQIFRPNRVQPSSKSEIKVNSKHHKDEFTIDLHHPAATCIFSEKVLIHKNEPTNDLNAVMKNYDVFSNTLCILPEHYIQDITEQFKFTWNKELSFMSGISLLPNQAGVILRVVGKESYQVQTEIKRFTKLVRNIIRKSRI